MILHIYIIHLIVFCCCVGVSCTSDAFHCKIRNDSADQVRYSCRFVKVT